MLDRRHIERILRINGIAATADDEEIRSVLISAKWQEDDVRTALTVLRENVNTKETRVDTLHDLFRTDQRLSPEAIESLLGIDVEVSSTELATLRESRKNVSFWQLISIIGYATVLAFASILTVMYIQNFGLFHPGL